MTCPKCGGEQLCPCESCADMNAGKVTWKWREGTYIICGHCGHEAHADVWMDLAYEAYKGNKP